MWLIKKKVFRHGFEGGATYTEPIPNIIPAPILCASGILNLTIVGIGMMKMRTSETIFATAMAMYRTAVSMHSPSPNEYGSHDACIGRHENRSSPAMVMV